MGSKLIRSKLDQTEWKDPELKKFIRPVESPVEYNSLLTQKILEEVGELLGASDIDSAMEEAADLVETIKAHVRWRGGDWSDVERIGLEKAANFGVFFPSNLVWEM